MMFSGYNGEVIRFQVYFNVNENKNDMLAHPNPINNRLPIKTLY